MEPRNGSYSYRRSIHVPYVSTVELLLLRGITLRMAIYVPVVRSARYKETQPDATSSFILPQQALHADPSKCAECTVKKASNGKILNKEDQQYKQSGIISAKHAKSNLHTLLTHGVQLA